MEKGKPAITTMSGVGKLPQSQVNVKASTTDLNVSDYDDFPDSDELAQKYGFDSPQKKEYVNNMIKDANMAEWGDSLLAKLDQKNKEIERLCTLLEAVQATPGIDPNKYNKLMDDGHSNSYVDPRDSKIVALAKKCRALTVALNKERASQEKSSNYIVELEKKCSRLENELKATPLVSEISAKSVHSTILSKDPKEPVIIDKDKDNERLKKEMSSANKTVEELRRKNDHLNEEIRKLQYALTRELGDGATIDDAVNGNWRGRAQQIIMLKTKIKKLENHATSDSTIISTTTGISRRSHDVDTKAEEELADMNSQRRQAVEAITEERFKLIEECKSLESKNKAQKARITTLEDSTVKQKQQLKVLVDKSDTDDQLIQALSQELQQLRKQINTLSAKNDRHISSQDQKVKVVGTGGSIKTANPSNDVSVNKMEIERLQRLCNQQASQLNVQENVIRDLRATLSNQKNY